MRELSRSSQVGMLALAVSLIFFGLDIVHDVAGHLLSNQQYSWEQIVHLLFEILAFASLIYAVFLLKEHHALLVEKKGEAEATVAVYREGADELLSKRLEEVKLSQAEREIAVFILKGLSPAEIAEFRGTAVGTVKTQTTSLFRKMEVSSRAELMSQLLHDVLDLDSLQEQGRAKAD